MTQSFPYIFCIFHEGFKGRLAAALSMHKQASQTWYPCVTLSAVATQKPYAAAPRNINRTSTPSRVLQRIIRWYAIWSTFDEGVDTFSEGCQIVTSLRDCTGAISVSGTACRTWVQILQEIQDELCLAVPSIYQVYRSAFEDSKRTVMEKSWSDSHQSR